MKKYALILFSAVGFAQQTPNVTIMGEGSVTATPDMITFAVSVETEGKNPATTKKENDDAIRKVIHFLESQKLSSKDYQTDYVNLYKTRDYYPDKTADNHYVARQKITILLKDINKYDDIIIGLLNSGITNIDSVQFGFQQQEKYMEEVRAKAIKNARKKAEEYAKAAGSTLGSVLFITENLHDVSEQPVLFSVREKMGSSNQTLAIGERELKVQVKVVYELK